MGTEPRASLQVEGLAETGGGRAEKQHLDTVTGGKEAQWQVNGPG